MRPHLEADFLHQMEAHGIIIDTAYPDAAVLGFRNRGPSTRFWTVPEEPRRPPYFIKTMLDLMGDWASCLVWRHLGCWPALEHFHPTRMNDRIEFAILSGIGIPAGTTDILEFTRDEMPALVTLLFATSIFGWSVGEDLYVVPDHARYILQTDHHGVFHVDFRDTADIDVWTSTMTKSGFPLPDFLPDEAFKQPDCKQPDWMPPRS